MPVTCCGGTPGRATSASCRTPSSGASSPRRAPSSPSPTSRSHPAPCPRRQRRRPTPPQRPLLPPPPRAPAPSPVPPPPAAAPLPAAAVNTPGSLDELERKAIVEALQRTHGHKSRAAAFLGLTRFQLYTRLKRYGIDLPDEADLAAS